MNLAVQIIDGHGAANLFVQGDQHNDVAVFPGQPPPSLDAADLAGNEKIIAYCAVVLSGDPARVQRRFHLDAHHGFATKGHEIDPLHTSVYDIPTVHTLDHRSGQELPLAPVVDFQVFPRKNPCFSADIRIYSLPPGGAKMDTKKWKSILVPREVYEEVVKIAHAEGRTISGQLRVIFSQWYMALYNGASKNES